MTPRRIPPPAATTPALDETTLRSAIEHARCALAPFAAAFSAMRPEVQRNLGRVLELPGDVWAGKPCAAAVTHYRAAADAVASIDSLDEEDT